MTGLKLFASHRQDTRDGYHQSLTTSHCSNCHVTGKTKALSESTRDVLAGASLRLSRLTLDATFGNRRFRDDAAASTLVYDKAVHPQSAQDVFLNRVIYDSRDGVLPYDTVPSYTKNTQTVKARVDLPADAVLTGHYTHSNTTNTDGDFGMDFSGGLGEVVVPLKKWVTMRASVRRYSIDADDVFVSLNEPVAPAGPSAGLTYYQAYPAVGPIDFLRESTLSRTPTEAELEFDFRPKKGTALRAEYGFEEVSRKASEVEKTVTNRLLGTGRSQFGKTLNVRFKLDQEWIRDPFANMYAAVPTRTQLFTSPGNVPFTGQQYFEMYDSRSVHLSGLPSSDFKGEVALTWTPAERTAISAHYRTRQATNDSLNTSEWQQSMHMPGAEVWFAPVRARHADRRLRVPERKDRDAVHHARLRWLSGRNHRGPVWLRARFGVLEEQQPQRLRQPAGQRNPAPRTVRRHGVQQGRRHDRRADVRPDDPAGQPAGLDFIMQSNAMPGFSALDLKQVSQTVGFNFKAADRVLVHGLFEYDDFDDDTAYLYNATGRHVSFMAGFSWIF